MEDVKREQRRPPRSSAWKESPLPEALGITIGHEYADEGRDHLVAALICISLQQVSETIS
jgi:hypothetical protein